MHILNVIQLAGVLATLMAWHALAQYIFLKLVKSQALRWQSPTGGCETLQGVYMRMQLVTVVYVSDSVLWVPVAHSRTQCHGHMNTRDVHDLSLSFAPFAFISTYEPAWESVCTYIFVLKHVIPLTSLTLTVWLHVYLCVCVCVCTCLLWKCRTRRNLFW